MFRYSSGGEKAGVLYPNPVLVTVNNSKYQFQRKAVMASAMS